MRYGRELQMLGTRCRKASWHNRQSVAVNGLPLDGLYDSGAERRGFGFSFSRRSDLRSPLMVRHRNTIRHIDHANTCEHDFAGLSEVKL